MSKINSYVGFAIKSRNIIYGTDSILASKSKCKLILVSQNLSQNAINKLKKVDQVVLLNADQFESLFGNTLAVAITDINLANAIKQNLQ